MNEVEAITGGSAMWPWVLVGALVALAVIGVVASMMLRTAVRPNEVHIVQSRSKRQSYGRNSEHGNAYWAIPEWVPIYGVQIVKLPLAVFDLDLPSYDAYDVGKVPFVVDIKAFFRIKDSNLAAERVENMPELEKQLLAILQGAVRKVLAFHDVEDIMMERSKFGALFTEETKGNLAEWGVENVKDIELMDVRDARDSETISNIMAKKESFIEKESRVEVAANKRDASMKEIEAQREVDVAEQQAEQKVGERTAEKDKIVGIANEVAQQEIKEQAKLTTMKEMAVKEVNDVRTSEIAKKVRVVQAEEKKQVDIVEAEGEKQQTVLVAEGVLTQQELNGKGILAVGKAEAEAKKLSELAVVDPQITLADSIGENEKYQDYMVRIREVEKSEAVGVEQAQALKAADLKVIVNDGSVSGGVDNVMDIFSPKGGTALAGMAEAFVQSETGKGLVRKFVDKD